MLRDARIFYQGGTELQLVREPQVTNGAIPTEQTYYRWRQKYGGMAPQMAKELKALQQENARLKKLVANQALDMEILREAAKGNF